MSPYDQYGKDYIQIGLGLKKTDFDIADIRYNYQSEKYSPEAKADDSSTIKPGFQDQYDQTPVNPDPVKPVVPDDSKNQTNSTGKGDCNAKDGTSIDCPDVETG